VRDARGEIEGVLEIGSILARHVRSTTLPLLIAFALGCSGQPADRLLLLVTVDTLRADHLGAYGSTLELTPRIDALAAESLRFTASYAPASYTLPSIASVHTGRYPEELGILANHNLFRGSSVTLAEILRLDGWRTGAAIGNYVLRRGTGIEIGFDEYDDTFSQTEENRDQPERTADHTTDAALAVLDRLRAAPGAGIFLWVHYQDPHGPYLPPGDRRERYLAAALATEDGRLELPSFGINAVGAIPRYQLVEDRHDVGFYRAGYAGEVRFVDDELGRLFDALDERGLLETAAIVLTADHGESLGESNYWFSHGEFLSDALVRVPLLLRAPGIAPGVRHDVASLIDLLPTLTGLAGVAAGTQFDGRDLLATVADDAPGRAYLATLMGSANKRWGWVENGRVYVRTEHRDGRSTEELRSLDSGVTLRDPEQRAQMRQTLARFRSQLRTPRAVEQQLTPHDREMLRQLGYLE
jgi:arylsulfatase